MKPSSAFLSLVILAFLGGSAEAGVIKRVRDKVAEKRGAKAAPGACSVAVPAAPAAVRPGAVTSAQPACVGGSCKLPTVAK